MLKKLGEKGHLDQYNADTQQAILDEKWPYMRQHVAKFVKTCSVCQKHSEQRVPQIRVEPFTTNAMAPMELLSIDTMGPFPESEEGYCHLVVIIDCFSRFVELYPVKSTSAVEAAKCLLNHCGRYGVPERLRSDNGSRYVNGVIDMLMEMLVVEHELTLPYSHEENGISKRVNKEVLKLLVNFIFQNDQTVDEWEWYIPLVQKVINATKHEALGMSPSEIVFGNRIDLELDDTNTSMDINAWADKMQNKQEQLIAVATRVQSELVKKNIKNRLKRKRDSLEDKEEGVSSRGKKQSRMSSVKEMSFSVGELVLLKHLLEIPWKGPFRIVAIDGSAVDIQDLATSKVRSIHISNLAKYLPDDGMDPRQVAAKDKRQYVVEAILNFERPAKGKERSNYKFLVKWMGWPKEEATWEPYDNVKNNAILHKFLREHNMSEMIPRRFV